MQLTSYDLERLESRLKGLDVPDEQIAECSKESSWVIICHDCGVNEGELHKSGCDMERCPFCGSQLISCPCCYFKLGFDYDIYHKTCNLPLDIYENGLTDELHDKWTEILNTHGRVPFIEYPNICAKCGAISPDLFMVPDDEWNHYIQLDMRDEIICNDCYEYIKKVVNQGKDDLQ